MLICGIFEDFSIINNSFTKPLYSTTQSPKTQKKSPKKTLLIPKPLQKNLKKSPKKSPLLTLTEISNDV
jgi:hypothetical protein